MKQIYVILSALFLYTSLNGQELSVDNKSRQLDKIVSHRLETFGIPGASVAIVKQGKIIYSKAYGYASLELQSFAKPETTYLIGSITKTFTATAIMMLWEEGKLQLEDSIGDYLPTLPLHWKPITIKQLLTHTSRIVTNLENANANCPFEFDCNNYTQANVIQETACLPLNFEPGTQFEYSGRNYYLLGMLIEKISGKTFDQFLKERIFDPLGMKETQMIDYNKLIANRASGYVLENQILANSERMNPLVELSDGGLMSTSLDLAKWIASFYTEKLVKRTTIEMMWNKARLSNGNSITQYGLGFGLTPYKEKRRIGHTGNIPGFSSCLTHFVDHNLTVILLTNITNANLHIGQMGNEMAEIYLK
jgi:CubicO group peptidase (beta-lactamase class C family)